MKEHIIELLSKALPMVNLDSDFLFSELDSLGVTTILMLLSEEYGIELEAKDATPKNLKTIDSIAKMVEEKLPRAALAISACGDGNPRVRRLNFRLRRFIADHHKRDNRQCLN